MFKPIATVTLSLLLTLPLGAAPIQAQDRTSQTDPDFLLDLNRAKNLARMAAERANGGLGYYRAESAMHGPASGTSYVANSDGSWTFTFRGSRPNSTAFTVESDVTVTRDGLTTVDYNGPLRSTAQ